MTKSEPSYHRPLNNHQILILSTLYKFRFITAKLITSSQNAKNIQVINSRLKILFDQQYIGRNYESSYKIKGKEATYFLLPKGIQYLKHQPFANPKVINALYHDKRRTDQHIGRCLNMFFTYIVLKKLYGEHLKFYSKSELYGKYFLPKVMPDALLNLVDKEKGISKYYFFDFFQIINTYRQNIAKVKRYIEFAESEKWQNTMRTDSLPRYLMICESALMAKRMNRLFERELETTFVDLKFTAFAFEDRLVLN